MKNIDGVLGKKIARHRRFMKLTQAQLAERVGVQPETISRIETGTATASFKLIEQVSGALHLELHELLRLQPSGPKEHAMERLVQFASRLTAAEIELAISVSAAVLDVTRRAQLEGSTPGPTGAR